MNRDIKYTLVTIGLLIFGGGATGICGQVGEGRVRELGERGGV